MLLTFLDPSILWQVAHQCPIRPWNQKSKNEEPVVDPATLYAKVNKNHNGARPKPAPKPKPAAKPGQEKIAEYDSGKLKSLSQSKSGIQNQDYNYLWEYISLLLGKGVKPVPVCASFTFEV